MLCFHIFSRLHLCVGLFLGSAPTLPRARPSRACHDPSASRLSFPALRGLATPVGAGWADTLMLAFFAATDGTPKASPAEEMQTKVIACTFELGARESESLG